jgi:hypothetical protein
VADQNLNIHPLADLLGDDSAQKPEPQPTPAEVQETLRPKDPVTGRPLAEKDLTPEQQRIRELEHQLAIQTAAKLDSGELEEQEEPEAANPNNILIHFLEDGFVGCGRVWYRGQELEFTPGSRAHEETKNRRGESWLDLTEMEQARRWGKIMFRRGPWPGDKYADEDAQKAERQRRRAAPVLLAR